MENLSYIGLSRQMALRRQMDVIAHNLANLDTTAYKRQRMLFQEFLLGGDPKRQKMSFVLDYGVARDTGTGRLQQTGNPLDVAVVGDGYLVVRTENGERYTKSGRLHLDDSGVLVNQTGDPVLDNSRQEITLGEADGEIAIGADGTISTTTGPIGRLDLVAFDNELELRPTVAGLYETDAPTIAPKDTQLRQGMLENSNVAPILEMTSMIHVLRSYQSTQRMLDTDHDLQRRAIERLGRVS